MRTPARRLVRSALPLAVLAALLAPRAASAARPRAIPPNVDTSVRVGNEAEDAVAVNPTNPSNIVTMSTLPGPDAGLFEGVSFDGGATWQRFTIGDGTDELGLICCDQQLAWDSFGNLWMVYLDDSPDVPIAVSTDGGLTFTKVVAIEPTKPKGSRAPKNPPGSKGIPAEEREGFGKGVASADQPSIDAGAGSVWVSYTSYPRVIVQAAGASVTGLGEFGSFTDPESVPTSRGRGNFGDTAVGPDGQVMVSYQDTTNGQGGSHLYTAVDPDGLGPKGFDDPVFLARSRVGGFDYIAPQPDRSVDAEVNLGWDRSGGAFTGRVYAIWTQEAKNESDDTDVMLQTSDDGGATWSSAVRLNDDDTRNSQFNPAIEVDPATGFVGVSWYDARADLGLGGEGDTDGVPNDDVQVWATWSVDGGATWVPNVRVSEGTSNALDAATTFDYGDYTHAAFQSGVFYPAWSDNSNSTGDNPDGTLSKLDLYVAAVQVGSR
jgi:hypothetical protein